MSTVAGSPRYLVAAALLPQPGTAQEARIAGLPALSRILIALARGGIGRAYAGPLSPSLQREVLDDLARARCALDVVWDDPPPLGQPMLLVAPGMIPEPGLVARMIVGQGALAVDRAGIPRLAWTAVPRGLPPGGLAELAGPLPEFRIHSGTDFIPLDPPDRATAAIFARTAKASDGIVSRRFNRPVSQWLSARLVTIPGLRPLHLTAVTAVLAVAMALCLARGGVAWIAAGCLLYHVASVADGLDGEIARATYRSSAFGATLDTAVDMATNLLFLLALGRGLLLTYAPVHAIAALAGFAVLLCGIAALTVLIRMGPGGGSFDTLAAAYFHKFRDNPAATRLGQGFNAIMKRDFFALAFALAGLVGLAWLIPWAFLALAVLWVAVIALCASELLRPGSRRLRPGHLDG